MGYFGAKVNSEWATVHITIYQAALATLSRAKQRHQDEFDENEAVIQQLLTKKHEMYNHIFYPMSL